MLASAVMSLGLVMTLTFDLWPWESLQQCPLAWWIFVPKFTEITPPGTEISCHAMLTEGQQTAGQLHGIPKTYCLRRGFFDGWSK